MASRGDLLAECSQELRSSKFEFETLLGASVTSVWQALGRHIARQLSQRKGVSLQQFGKFGFYKMQTSMLPPAPVFLLADRFTSTYGVVWRHRSPPAPLTATTEINMAALGHDAELGSDQTRRSLDAIVTFVGKKLQGGESAGRMALPGVGNFTLDGKTLAFTFDANLLRTITQNDRVDIAPPSVIFRKKSAVDILRKKSMQHNATNNNPVLQRSLSLDGALQDPNKPKQHVIIANEDDLGDTGKEVPDNNNDDKAIKRNKEKRRHHRKHRQKRKGLTITNNNNTEVVSLNERQILPRFLIPDPRIPPEMLKPRPAHDQVLQAAFQREMDKIEQAKNIDIQFNDMQAARQRIVQIHDLQKRAEEVVARRELNAFLNVQIEEKRKRTRQKSADFREIKILPLEREINDEMRRAEKKKLNQRLNEQVAAKAALKKDRRTLDQAESAYFISRLKMQDEIGRQELAEQKRIEKETLLSGWSQQKAIRAQKSTMMHIR